MYKGIIIFGTMGSGKDVLGEAIIKQLYTAKVFKLGKYIRKLGDLFGGAREDYQNIGEGVREKVSIDIWNKITETEIDTALAEIWNLYPMICDGRQTHEFEYWNNRGYLTVGITAPLDIRRERLQNRDGYLPSDQAFMHDTEIRAHYVATQLCKILIENDTNELEDLDVAAHGVVNIIKKGWGFVRW